MEAIIEPVDKALIKAELTPERFLRDTNRAGNEIYIVNVHNAPNTLREIGRLREVAFRDAGGGTGKALDLDEFDLCDNCYQQMIVWDPDHEAIVGGYRFIYGGVSTLKPDGQPYLATSHILQFSDKFIKEYLPVTIELARSFVSLEYQNTRKHPGKCIFALDNLWDGLGGLTYLYPDAKYYFGKVTMYPSFNRWCRDLILYFLDKHFGDGDRLVWPKIPLVKEYDTDEFKSVLAEDDFKKDYKLLNGAVRSKGYNIPPLVNSYMQVCMSLKVFGTAVSDDFGNVEETGILVPIFEMEPVKAARYIGSFLKGRHRRIMTYAEIK